MTRGFEVNNSLKRLMSSSGSITTILIAIGLFILPFFWYDSSQMDLGGDGSRLYYYDPLTYLKNVAIYGIEPEGMGKVMPNQYYIPYLSVLILAKQALGSSYLLIGVLTGIKLSVAFLSVFSIINLLIKKDTSKSMTFPFAAILGGLFYVFTPAMIGNMDKSLLTHDQIFLNPLMFYLVLLYCLKKNVKYLWTVLALTLAFTANFSLKIPPALFSFYPLSLMFIFIYVSKIKKKNIPWKGLTMGFFAFLGLHAFHLIPEFLYAIEPGSDLHNRAFVKGNVINESLNYFIGILPLGKLSLNLFYTSMFTTQFWTVIIFPLILILGIYYSAKNKTLLLVYIFFLMTLFLVSANVTSLGVEMYKLFFSIPGFSMFRNYVGQWQFIFAFFYALSIGLAIATLMHKISKVKKRIIFIVLTGVLLISANRFISGELVNRIHSSTKNTKIAIDMDPEFEKTLKYINQLPYDAKILTLPFSDSSYQVLHGESNGAYVGPSMISYLSNKKDFAAYQTMSAMYAEDFMLMARNKDYKSMRVLLNLLNIKYIFHNDDKRIYNKNFATSPYDYVRKSLPDSQNDYKKFISNLSPAKIYQNKSFLIYELNNELFLPHFYVPNKISIINQSALGNPIYSVIKKYPSQGTFGFMDSKACQEIFKKYTCLKDEYTVKKAPKIAFHKISPLSYKIKITNIENDFVLIFSEKYYSQWNLFKSEKSKIKENIGEKKHIVINGYANAWKIDKIEINGKKELYLTAEMVGQQTFYKSTVISIISIILFFLFGIKLILPNK